VEKIDKNNSALLLRLPEELKAALQRQAILNGRRITSEINTRLRDSLNKNPSAPGIAPSHITPPNTAHDAPTYLPSQSAEDAMLAVFRSLPPEKQLALLSLFK
jgi:hypothetical protein